MEGVKRTEETHADWGRANTVIQAQGVKLPSCPSREAPCRVDACRRGPFRVPDGPSAARPTCGRSTGDRDHVRRGS
jgi:hypothetical protein